jgi:hypothetical protein
LIVEELRQLGKSWDSFLLSADIPRDPKGDPPLPMGKATSHSAEAEIERAAEKGKTVEALSPQQPIPRKRGRPRKNRETREAQAPSEPRTKSVMLRSYSCTLFGWNLSKVQAEKPVTDREGRTLETWIFMSRHSS